MIIALPLWLHDVAAFKAMRAGKHVLTEKLMGQTVSRCKEMGRLAEESKDANGNPIVFAVGHQRHYSVLYANAVDQIRRGLLGDLHHIRAQWHRGNMPGNDSWCPPLPEAADYQYDVFDAAIVAAEARGDNKQKAALVAAHPLYAKLRAAKGASEERQGGRHRCCERRRSRRSRSSSQDIDIELAAGKDYGYVSKTLDERQQAERARRADSLAAVGSHRRRPHGRTRQPSARRLEHLRQLAARRRRQGLPDRRPGIGFRSLFPADRDVDDHVHCNFEFPGKHYYEDIQKQEKVEDPNSKIVVTYSSINGNGFGGYGEVVLGTGGTLILDREQEVMLYKGGDASTKIEVKETGKGKAAMSSYETGGGPPVAVAAAARRTSAAATRKRSSTGPGAFATRRPSTSRSAAPRSPWPTRSSRSRRTSP